MDSARHFGGLFFVYRLRSVLFATFFANQARAKNRLISEQAVLETFFKTDRCRRSSASSDVGA
jgi:hypothetical protein